MIGNLAFKCPGIVSSLAPYWAFLILTLSFVLGSQTAWAQKKRALLIGISNYAPPAGSNLPVLPEGHAADSRFAPGVSWPVLRGPLVDIASIEVLLKDRFDFQDIRVLKEQQATRQGILAAIDQLAADTRPGDFDVLYYAGHGSLRLDTLSSKNHFDETIVPIDAWKGSNDIRDKELALRFNQIVYDKRAHLTAIFDSCNSGTMARGMTGRVVRALPYDDRDVAEEKKKDPSIIVEIDLKQIPQDGDAIIVAAAASNESAEEALFSDDRRWHGAFSRALVQVLRSSTRSLSAADVVAQVSNMLHADSLFQQPSVEGRIQQSMFGPPVAEHPMHVHALKAFSAAVTLDLGSAGGFDIGTQFTAIEPDGSGKKIIVEVAQIDEPLLSTAKIIEGSTNVKPGQIFELSKMVYQQTARLVIFTAKPEADVGAATARAKALYPALKWIDDPTDTAIDYLVLNGAQGWVACDQSGRMIPPGPEKIGTAFLLLGLPASVRAAIEQTEPFQRKAFTFTDNLAEANYLLAMRQRAGGLREYAFLDRNILTPHDPQSWIKSEENDPEDVKLNGGIAPDVVCRNDTSLPVRSAWLHESPADNNSLIQALNRRIIRLGKLRVWLQATGISPGISSWPYHLAITAINSEMPIQEVLRPNQKYEVRLVTTPEERAAGITSPKYVYLLGFDCAANPFLLYPNRSHNGDAMMPQPGPEGVFGLSVRLGIQEAVGKPLGADTLFLLATPQKLSDPGILVRDGVLDSRTRGPQNAFDTLVNDMNDAGIRGLSEVPANWQMQSLVLPSKQ
jgi:hypothetical protein